MNYDGERNWDSSGYLSLFRYDFKDLSVTENQLPNAVLAINRIYSKFIHFLFLPIDIQESHLQDSDPEAPHWVYKLPNIPGPHFFRTDKLHPPSKVNPETKEVIEYASRYICEHLYLGPWDPDRMTVYTETESEDSLFASLRKRAAERKPVPTEEIIEHLNKRFAQTPLSAATSATASNATMVGNNPPIGVRGCSRQPRIEKPPYTAAASSTSGYVSQSSSSAVVTSTAYFEPNRVEPPPPTPLTTNSPPDNSGAVGEPSQKKQKLDGDVAAACTANDPNESYLSPIPPIASLGTTRQRERSASSNIASNASSSSAAVASSSAASRSSPSTSDEARMFDDQHK
ncbi:MAG: hypothetical protein NVV73_01465 [Cellvibrionaceae bacterium]|nr:hypothetical protein [Cellvibrionaceae bacterium]